MKRFIITAIAWLCVTCLHAAYLRDIPMTLTQPDGTVLHCFASGDEFFNYLHDANGYTIIQHPLTGYYVYADKQDGKLVATNYTAGRYDPASKHLTPYNLISPEEWMARRKAWEEPEMHPKNRDNINHGTLNNIAIFIRFSDDSEFTNTYSSIDNMFNNMTGGYGTSMRSYFQVASYGAIDIPTTFYPGHNNDAIISYQDTYPRSYFQPYNASTNTNGYNGDDQRRTREFDLLQRAVNYINSNYPIPSGLNIDFDNDGLVDNVCFIVRGDVGDWNSLLWPHKWSLYDRTVRINGKRVYTFNFQLADAVNDFNTSTMCHEMNHSLGAPDLYHYSYSGPDPVGSWDLMNLNSTPPQHCGAYMKMKYGHWIDEIPEITQAGTYTLNPISSATPTNIAYKIASSDPNQFYVVEYRDANTETALPGSGLLVYRIDTRFNGNADYDPSKDIYDEVYIFRPDGSYSSEGSLNLANFSANVNRTEFSPTTNPYPFFSESTLDDNIRIYDITNAGSTISFKYASAAQCEPPTNLVASVNGRDVTLSWDAATGANSYRVLRDGNPLDDTRSTNYLDETVPYGTHVYCVRSLDAEGNVSVPSNSQTITISYSGPVITDLQATVNNNNINLSWTPLVSENAELKYTTYQGGYYYGGYNEITDTYWGIRFPASMMADYAGMAIESVANYIRVTGSYSIYVYQCTTPSPSETPLLTLENQNLSSGWRVTSFSPIYLDSTKDLWIIYKTTDIDRPITMNQVTTSDGNYYSSNGSNWSQWDGKTWFITANITDGTYTYNLYRNGEAIGTNMSATNYTDSNRNNTANFYTVTTNYFGRESAASNGVGYALGQASLGSLSLGSNDQMTITENSTLSISGTLSDVSVENLILENGAQLVNNSDDVLGTVKKTVAAYTQDGGWNLLASPIADGITLSSDNGLLTNSYDLYTFDQSQDLEWRNYEAEAFSTIENKTGYLYANSGNLTTISFAGTLANTATPTTLTYDGNATWKGFNLIGNPYPCNAYIDRSFYVLNTNGSDFTLGSNPIPPCSAILVQAQGTGESVTFSKEALDKKVSIVAKLTTMDAKGERVIDQARVCFDEADQLTKFTMGQGTARLYIPQGNRNYAVACANGQNEMPLNFKAAQNGTYTLDFKVEDMETDYLHLIDNMTGADVDLLTTPSYTFESSTDDYEARFKLVFANYEDTNDDNVHFAYYADGEIRLVETCHGASLQVVDMMGRVVLAGDAMNRVPTAGMTAGVYVLRLINGEQVKTQKIVVR